jgi:hypothetical protein
MHSAAIIGSVAVLSIWLAHNSDRGQESPAPRRPFECERSFLATDDSKTLAARFGASAVATGEIYLGEGFSETGTVLFNDAPEN